MIFFEPVHTAIGIGLFEVDCCVDEALIEAGEEWLSDGRDDIIVVGLFGLFFILGILQALNIFLKDLAEFIDVDISVILRLLGNFTVNLK